MYRVTAKIIRGDSMRKTFHEELDTLRKEILRMGDLVDEAISNSVRSLIDGDIDLAAKVIQGDDAIDEINLAIEEQSMYVIARQCPVAGDLRLIHSMLFISIHLERMGDLALNVAKTTRRTQDEESIPSLLDLIADMGEKTQGVVRTSLKAFNENDIDLARTLPEMDDPIDQLFKEFFKELARAAAKKGSFEWASNMVLASRYLERIADHGVDIGERVTYLVTGVMQDWE